MTAARHVSIDVASTRILGDGDQLTEPQPSSVRPYTLTGGRVFSALSGLPLEALVETLPAAVAARGLTPEKRAILDLAAHAFVSIAELSALLRLPIGVVRVLVSDLKDFGLVTVHASTPTGAYPGEDGVSMSVLEWVLSGINAL
jgi:hypothetical protein